MPKPILPPPSHEDIAGTLAERLVGRDGRQRSTKTWIPSTTLINRFGLLGNHADRLIAVFRVLATNEAIQQHQASGKAGEDHTFNRYAQRCACTWTPPAFTDQALSERFTCIQAYQGLHRQVLSHLGSYKGFLVRSVSGQSTEGTDQTISSAGAAQPTTPPPVKPIPPTPAPGQNGHASKAEANGMAMR